MTTAHASVSQHAGVQVRPRSTGILAALLVPATMLTIMAVALLLLLTPIWTHFAIGASGGGQNLATPDMANGVSDKTIWELFFGPGTFSYSNAPGPVLFSPDEAAHMRDVRVVLYAFLGLAAASAVLLVWRVRRTPKDPRTWLSIARGGFALAVVLVLLGAIAAVAFGVAFELFHRILFPGGTWSFSPDSQLIRLYPYGFWQLSAAAFGALGIAGGLLVWFLGRRKARQLSAQTDR